MRSSIVTGLAGALLLAACSGEPERAPSGLDADPFAPMSEAALEARIREARRQARASGRRVLLDFVADWCEDCREVVRLSREEPARSVLEARYVVVYVEVGRFDRHRALIDAHGVDRIATLVVLDPESGERVAKTTLEPISGGERGLTAAQLAAWLRHPR
jgi:thiol:disulfide interchange protein